MTAGSARYAIIIATKDRGSKIVPLLESIARQTAPDFELVIADQSLADDTEKAVAPFLTDPRMRYVRSTERGLSRGRNLAISHTTAPYLVITDDDCIVPPEWLAAITRPFDERTHTGVVFCSVAAVPTEELGHTPHVIFEQDRLLTTVGSAWRAARRGLPLGAGMAVRRSMYDQLGGFDELLGPGGTFGASEDSDLSWRGLLHGWSTAHIGSVTVMHDGFRDLEELRALVDRDFYGVGGALAKYLRAEPWKVRLQAALFIAWWACWFGLVLPGQDALHGRRPRGFRRPVMLARGVVGGLRTPMERPDLLYRRRPRR